MTTKYINLNAKEDKNIPIVGFGDDKIREIIMAGEIDCSTEKDFKNNFVQMKHDASEKITIDSGDDKSGEVAIGEKDFNEKRFKCQQIQKKKFVGRVFHRLRTSGTKRKILFTLTLLQRGKYVGELQVLTTR